MNIRAPTNTNLLKAKIAEQGYDAYVSYLAGMLFISRTTASKKLYGYAQFTQSEIITLRDVLDLSIEDVNTIFLGGST